ncbi:MAG: hypothetical protein EZS28_040040, partial [Streblomastix strix]
KTIKYQTKGVAVKCAYESKLPKGRDQTYHCRNCELVIVYRLIFNNWVGQMVELQIRATVCEPFLCLVSLLITVIVAPQSIDLVIEEDLIEPLCWANAQIFQRILQVASKPCIRGLKLDEWLNIPLLQQKQNLKIPFQIITSSDLIYI